MVDIYQIPLFYISFEPSQEIDQHYRDHGFHNVFHFSAVNGKKMDIDTLRKEKKISIRCYDDLKSGSRTYSSAMPSLGGIGCTLSHYELWCKCVEENWPYIIIAEEDNRMNEIKPEQLRYIQNHMLKKNSFFVSKSLGRRESYIQSLNGTHFCIVSNGACRELKKHCFPIDVQTDWYVAHLGSRKQIELEGFAISSQGAHFSSIQDLCPLCVLPKSNTFYICVGIAILMIIIAVIIMRRKVIQCEKVCLKRN